MISSCAWNNSIRNSIDSYGIMRTMIHGNNAWPRGAQFETVQFGDLWCPTTSSLHQSWRSGSYGFSQVKKQQSLWQKDAKKATKKIHLSSKRHFWAAYGSLRNNIPKFWKQKNKLSRRWSMVALCCQLQPSWAGITIVCSKSPSAVIFLKSLWVSSSLAFWKLEFHITFHNFATAIYSPEISHPKNCAMYVFKHQNQKRFVCHPFSATWGMSLSSTRAKWRGMEWLAKWGMMEAAKDIGCCCCCCCCCGGCCGCCCFFLLLEGRISRQVRVKFTCFNGVAQPEGLNE